MSVILVVDDSAIERRVIGGWLERGGDFSVAYASDGVEALQWLRNQEADLVVTDMQMPNMNGLELVAAARSEFPETPVILVTAQGSEELASKALQQGAASYVPKSQFRRLLTDTVNHVLSLAHPSNELQAAMAQATSCDVHFSLANDPTKVTTLVGAVQTLAGNMGICDPTGQLQLGIAVEQALLNAIYHGNLEIGTVDNSGSAPSDREMLCRQRQNQPPYCDRKVRVQVKVTQQEICVAVKDDGSGFDVQKLTQIPLTESLVDPSGRGFVLMWALMDRVIFSKTGNQVTLVKHCDPRPSTETPVTTETQPILPDTLGRQSVDLGVLIPLDGKPSIPLPRRRVVIGRDPKCDIAIKHPRVSLRHCLLFVHSGWWYVKCLKERGVVRVNHATVSQGRLAPESTLRVGDREFRISYDLAKLGAVGITPPVDPF